MNSSSGRRSRSLWFTLALCCLPSLASPQWNKDGKPVPDEAWRKSIGEFGAMLILTTNDEDFFRRWDQPARPGYVPNVSPAETAARGDKASALIFFVGCTPDPHGSCLLRADFKVLRPDGSIYGDPPPLEVWRARAPPGNNVQVSRNHLEIRFEETDPLGRYSVLVAVRDETSDTELALVQTIDLVAAQAP